MNPKLEKKKHLFKKIHALFLVIQKFELNFKCLQKESVTFSKIWIGECVICLYFLLIFNDSWLFKDGEHLPLHKYSLRNILTNFSCYGAYTLKLNKPNFSCKIFLNFIFSWKIRFVWFILFKCVRITRKKINFFVIFSVSYELVSPKYC